LIFHQLAQYKYLIAMLYISYFARSFSRQIKQVFTITKRFKYPIYKLLPVKFVWRRLQKWQLNRSHLIRTF